MRRLAIGVAVLAALAFAAPAAAGPGSGPTAAVSLGDSYISGEAGRWAGNSITPTGDKDGTDRACLPAGPACQVDKTRVYEPGTEDAGCHRSDVSEIHSASLPVAQRIDLSCSGAVTRNIFRAASGGQGQNGEPPQADKLLPVARSRDVKLVMLSIGGNDLGFASIISACLQAYLAKTGPCEPSQQPKIDAKVPQVKVDVGKAIAEVKAVMAQAGYAPTDYRLILQTYPSVAPRASEARYPEAGPERTVNGCPFYDQDATWARDRAAAQIGSVSKAAAQASGVETLDLLNAFQGHEFCSRFAAQNTPFSRPSAAGAEWGRFLGASTVQQGELQEAFHPNAYGQRAIGACVTKAFAATPGAFDCSGAASLAPGALALARRATFNRPRITSCLAARSPVGRKGIGRLTLGVTRRRLLASPRLASIAARSRTSRRYRYCVKKSRGLVTAVFGKQTKVELLLATPAKYGNKGVRPGSTLRTAKRRFRGLTRVKGTSVYRLSRRSLRFVGVRRSRVRYVGVASKRVLGSRRLLRAYVRRASR